MIMTASEVAMSIPMVNAESRVNVRDILTPKTLGDSMARLEIISQVESDDPLSQTITFQSYSGWEHITSVILAKNSGRQSSSFNADVTMSIVLVGMMFAPVDIPVE
jgi:hypothetical protein